VRRALPILIVCPVVSGFFIVRGIEAGLFKPAFAVALAVWPLMLAGLIGLIHTAQRQGVWYRELAYEQQRQTSLRLKLASVLDSSSDAILLFDQNMNVLRANEGASRLFGYSERELVKMALNDFIPPRFHARHHQYVADFSSGRNRSLRNDNPQRMIAQSRDGEEIPVSISIVSKHAEGQTLYAATIRDAREMEAQLNSLRSAAERDPLTGTYNRRALTQRAEELNDHNRRQHDSYAVLALDIDFFKKINDNYGHATGDLVLQAFARLCLRQLRGGDQRDGDQLYRTGGEEFIIVSPGNSLEGATKLAQRICDATFHTPFMVGLESGLQLSCSIGVTLHTSPEERFAEALNRADEHLYEAKHRGRNRVVSDLSEEAANQTRQQA
jgi:diguanylate cyclase (GGDEF)-like protein/PAS domain S-box-containing protein